MKTLNDNNKIQKKQKYKRLGEISINGKVVSEIIETIAKIEVVRVKEETTSLFFEIWVNKQRFFSQKVLFKKVRKENGFFTNERVIANNSSTPY